MAGRVPPVARRRRGGARAGVCTEQVRQALRSEATQLSQLEDPSAQIRGVGDAFAPLDAELELLAEVRLAAARQLRGLGWPYARIANQTGLSKGRVAQLTRDARDTPTSTE